MRPTTNIIFPKIRRRVLIVILAKMYVLHLRERCLRLSKHVLSYVEGATRVVATSARPFENLKERATLVRFRPFVDARQVAAWRIVP